MSGQNKVHFQEKLVKLAEYLWQHKESLGVAILVIYEALKQAGVI